MCFLYNWESHKINFISKTINFCSKQHLTNNAFDNLLLCLLSTNTHNEPLCFIKTNHLLTLFWAYIYFFKECLKPVFGTDDEEAKKTAQITLFRALDVGLRLLSPFMPFITEELYQRLPRNKEIIKEIPSICIAPYPETKDYRWKNEVIESEVEFIQKVAKHIRSVRSDYNLPNKTKTEGKV